MVTSEASEQGRITESMEVVVHVEATCRLQRHRIRRRVECGRNDGDVLASRGDHRVIGRIVRPSGIHDAAEGQNELSLLVMQADSPETHRGRTHREIHVGDGHGG